MRRAARPRRRNGALALAIALAFGLALALPATARAHPLGNFSISHYSGLFVGADAVTVRYLIDMAEIPTFQEMQEAGIVADPAHPATARYLDDRAETLARGLKLEIDGRRLPLAVQSREIAFPPGAGDLPTLKMRVVYRATLGGPVSATHRLAYQDENYPDRAGWKEIIAAGESGVVVQESSVPRQDRSRELAEYPTDLLESPPQHLAARLTFARPSPAPLAATTPGAATPAAPPSVVAPGRPSAPSTSPAARPLEPQRAADPDVPRAPHDGDAARSEDRLAPVSLAAGAPRRDAFSDLIATKELGLGIVLTALGAAAVLGAFHALEPGHGKTVVAAYLVGARGTAWHAVILGVVVTLSHTAGVYLLGAVTFYASRYVVPERLYPWLGATSGLTIAILGAVLFLRRYAGRGGHAHDHGHAHHGVHAHAHEHPHGAGAHHGHHHHHDADPPGAAGLHRDPHAGHEGAGGHGRDSVTLRELMTLGISGGIVPCPAALVVLLSALSLRRVGFGMLLIVAFSVGLALVLIAIGVLMVSARRLMSRYREESPLLTRWLPLTSSAVIVVIGVAIAVQALTGAGVLVLRLG